MSSILIEGIFFFKSYQKFGGGDYPMKSIDERPTCKTILTVSLLVKGFILAIYWTRLMVVQLFFKRHGTRQFPATHWRLSIDSSGILAFKF